MKQIKGVGISSTLCHLCTQHSSCFPNHDPAVLSVDGLKFSMSILSIFYQNKIARVILEDPETSERRRGEFKTSEKIRPTLRRSFVFRPFRLSFPCAC